MDENGGYRNKVEDRSPAASVLIAENVITR